MSTKKSAKKTAAKSTKKTARRPYVIVRCRNAGVHAGELVARKGTEVRLANSRRLWYWDGAASLSEIAVYGASKPQNCKFCVVLPTVDVLDACEIIVCQPAGERMIREQPAWRA